MGYCTLFTLYIDDDPNYEKLAIVREKEGENSELCFAIDEVGDTYSSEARWYEWKTDMRRISALWPNFTFHLSGEGEEHSDKWEATFRAGKAHIREAVITIEEFDEDKLE